MCHHPQIAREIHDEKNERGLHPNNMKQARESRRRNAGARIVRREIRQVHLVTGRKKTPQQAGMIGTDSEGSSEHPLGKTVEPEGEKTGHFI